ncbi:hypothetical protein [Kitasatospora sp. NPDC059571]|uniref:hypothetical protein n=1 Tax=Kitasatospora sp. NPDC059571 TaxID=3346871 RepID=UPI00368552A3
MIASPKGWIMDEGAQLLPDERVLWTGRPGRTGPSGTALAAAAVLLAMGAAMTGLVVVQWGAEVDRTGAARAFVVAGWCLQLGALLYRLLVSGPAVRRTEQYTVTDRRLVVRGAEGTDAWWLDALPEPRLRGSDVVLGGAGTGLAAVVAELLRTPSAAPLPVLRAPEDPQGALAALQQGRAVACRPPAAAPEPAAGPAPELPAGFAPAARERVLWTGRPGAVRWWYGPYELVQALSAVAAAGFAVALGLGTEPVFLVVTALFALGALWLGPGALVLRRLRAPRTVHVLTDRRLVRVRGAGPRGSASVPLAGLAAPRVAYGAVVLEPVEAAARGVGRRGAQEVLLVGLDDPDEVARTVAQAQLAVRGRYVAPAGPVPPEQAGRPEGEDGEDGAWNRWT